MGLETGQFAQSCQVRGTQALSVGWDSEVLEQLVCYSIFSEIRSKWRLVRPCSVRGTHGACPQVQSCPQTVSCGRSFQPLHSWSPFTLRVSRQSIAGVQHCTGVGCTGSDSATHTRIHSPRPGERGVCVVLKPLPAATMPYSPEGFKALLFLLYPRRLSIFRLP